MTNDELQKSTDTWSRDLLAMIIPEEKALFNLVANFVRERKLKLCVAMRNGIGDASFQEERDFFLLNGGSQMVLTPRMNLSSYDLVLSSHLSVCLFSTLGYEALGLNKRVIFSADCKNIKDFFTRDIWNVNYSAHKMPDLIKLKKMEYAEFNDKATKLLEKPNEEYLQQTGTARRYYMNIDLKTLPQISIKNEITNILNKSI